MLPHDDDAAPPTPAQFEVAADDRLDEALEESFPASDPIALRVD